MAQDYMETKDLANAQALAWRFARESRERFGARLHAARLFGSAGARYFGGSRAV
jgi:S-methylmethionine-dependent homocysteine/selenocysteine methylase